MKLNNKGFSLIEILAVVVIVAVISTIGIISVRRLIDNSKRHFYDTQEKQVVLAAQAYANDNKNILPKDIGGITRIKLQDLIDKNYIKEDIVDEQGNLCYTEPKTIKDKKGKDVDIDGTYVDVLKVNQTEYKYSGVLQCEKCLEETDYRGATCETSKTKLNPDIDIYVPQIDANNDGNTIFNTTDAIKITIDAVQKSGSYDESILIVSYSYKIYVNNELRMNSGTKLNNKKNQIIINDEKIFKYVPGVVKVVVTATNSEGKTITKSKSSNLKDATSPLCGRVTYDNNNRMKDYNYVSPNNIKCGTTSYPWINIGTDPGDRHVWIQCNDQEGVGCQQQEYSLNLDEDGEDQNVVIKDTNNYSLNCPVKKCVDKTTTKIKFNIRSSKTGSVKKHFTIDGQKKEKNYKPEETYNTWLNGVDYPNGVFMDIELEDPTSKIRSITWTESDSAPTKNALGAATAKVYSKKNANAKEIDNISNKVTEDGFRLERVKVEDYAGNIIDLKVIVKIDRTKPTCSLDDYDNECENSGVTVKLYCNDDMSGVNSCGGTSKNGEKNTNVKKTGLKQDTSYTVKDVAGNSTSCSTKIYNDTQWRKASCSTCSRCSAAGCDTYKSCANSACGTHCCKWSYELCLDGHCLKSTTTQASGPPPGAFNTSCLSNCYNSCRTSGCGCETYTQSCPKCGCDTWGKWSDWSYNELNCNGTTKNTCKIGTQKVYRHQTQKCKDGIVKPTNKKIKCSAGNYLQAGKDSCSTCKSGYYCPGGEWYIDNSKDQGLKDCPAGYKNSPAGSSKIAQCFMNVSKNNYVAKAKDSSSTKCAPGYIKEFHKVNYGDVSSCQIYSARKYNGVYVECRRDKVNGVWAGDCSQRYIFSEGGMDVGTYRVKVTENEITFQGFCNVIQTSGLTYYFTIYALDENGNKDSDTILMNTNNSITVYGQPTGPYKPENRANYTMNWKTQVGKRGPDLNPKDSDCYDHGNHNL